MRDYPCGTLLWWGGYIIEFDENSSPITIPKGMVIMFPDGGIVLQREGCSPVVVDKGVVKRITILGVEEEFPIFWQKPQLQFQEGDHNDTA